jgi:fructokinase
LPRGIFLGGAPLNVAYHLSRLGVSVVPVSAVGRDFLGDEALRRIAGWGVSTDFISRLRRYPTGTVRAQLDARGVAAYDITTRVAWDRIVAPGKSSQIRPPRAIVFGSLALRGGANRRALLQMFEAWPAATRVLDLNLRSPFDRGPGIAFALRHAQIVKLNDEELSRMTKLPVGTVTQIEAAARRFASIHGCAEVCVTAGPRGAGLLSGGNWFWQNARAIEVRDTVGAGDAFLAAFLARHLTAADSPDDALANACRLGEFVAAHDGATPPYQMDAKGGPH